MLRDKDASGALDQVAAGSLTGLDRSLLTDAALAEPAADMQVVSTSVDEDSASVEVKQTFPEGEHTSTFSLVRDGRRWGIWPGWKLQNPWPSCRSVRTRPGVRRRSR